MVHASTILIPAFQPDEALLGVIRGIVSKIDNPDILIVNDGSTSNVSEQVFQLASSMRGVEVVHFSENRGKGAALKSGLDLIDQRMRKPNRVVTADADGQHLPADIVKIALWDKDNKSLVIGQREFGKGVPVRSRIGNLVTKKIFNFFLRVAISDTQSGLRSIPVSEIPSILEFNSNGYEFEFQVLGYFAKKRQIHKEVISTVYEPGNPTSHFRPLIDSTKIYFIFLRHISAVPLIALLEYCLFSFLILLNLKVLWALTISRGLATVLYFVSARSYVFKASTDLPMQAAKFIMLVAANIAFLERFISFLITNFQISPIISILFGYFVFFCLNFFFQNLIFARYKNG